MKKLFFCIFSIIFITLCVFLGLSTESYAYYTSDNTEHRLNDIEFQNVPNFTDILSALENYSFEDNNQVSYCTYNEIFSSYYYIKVDPSASYYNRVFIYFSLADTLNTDTNSPFNDNGVTYNRYLYTFNSTPCLSCVYDLDNNSNYILKLYYRYNASNSNTTDLLFMPKYQVNSTFNDGYKQVFSNCELTYNNSIIENVEQAPIEPPGEEEEEDKTLLETIQDFFANFGDNLVHIVVPSQEDMEELQESFEENILDKFSITAISRSSSYDNNSLYPLEYENHKPVFNIYGYEFQSSMITDFLNTPISFGKLQNFQSNTEHSTEIATGGLTPFAIINLLFGINITAFNIIMFNKFFEKE